MNPFSKATLILLLAYSCSTLHAQDRLLIYDGRAEAKPSSVSAADQSLIKRFALPKARAEWRASDVCKEEFEAIGVARGSFTKPKSEQRAILYRFCETGHDFANNGIVILEGNNFVLQILYSGGEDYDINSPGDLNGDGLSDIVLGDGSTHQGYTNAVATIIALGPHNVKKLGMVEVYEDDCGAKQPCKALAYVVYASAGTQPNFVRETYRKRGSRWTKLGTSANYKPDTTDTEYKVVR